MVDFMAAEKQNIQVSIPGEFAPFVFQLKDGKTIDEKVKLQLAIGLFLSKTVTLAKAAELAGESLWEFIDLLKAQGIDWGEYGDEQERQDELTISKIFAETEEQNG
jgi:predicted HTH domain antitoxin